MPLVDTVRRNLQRSVDLYRELISDLPEQALAKKLPGLRSNTIGAQIWCVVGARESYRRAIAAGEWSGFSCSLDGDRVLVKPAVLEALASSGSGILAELLGLSGFTDTQNQLVTDLLEHEAAHQGQLIRYLYGLELPIPTGWKARYALDGFGTPRCGGGGRGWAVPRSGTETRPGRNGSPPHVPRRASVPMAWKPR